MKKMLFAALLAAVMCGCGDKKGGSSSSSDEDNDSIEILLRENEQLRNELSTKFRRASARSTRRRADSPLIAEVRETMPEHAFVRT